MHWSRFNHFINVNPLPRQVTSCLWILPPCASIPCDIWRYGQRKPSASALETGSGTTGLSIDSGHHKNHTSEMLHTHLIVDIEPFGKKPDSPVVSIGAVFFDPSTVNTGSEFYKVISLESSMASGGVLDAFTIIFWLKSSPEARSELVMDDAIPLDDALLQLNEFISENAANGPILYRSGGMVPLMTMSCLRHLMTGRGSPAH